MISFFVVLAAAQVLGAHSQVTLPGVNKKVSDVNEDEEGQARSGL